MKEHRILIRTSYWVAAVADFIIAILVLIPERMGVTGFVYPMGLMSAVAFSWGVLLILASLGYLIDSFGKLLLPNYDANIALFTFIGEVLLIFWLFIKGARIPDQS